MSLEPLFPAEQNNEVSWYTSGLAGIVSGGIKVVESGALVRSSYHADEQARLVSDKI